MSASGKDYRARSDRTGRLAEWAVMAGSGMTAFEIETVESCCSLGIFPADLFRPVPLVEIRPACGRCRSDGCSGASTWSAAGRAGKAFPHSACGEEALERQTVPGAAICRCANSSAHVGAAAMRGGDQRSGANELCSDPVDVSEERRLNRQGERHLWSSQPGGRKLDAQLGR